MKNLKITIKAMIAPSLILLLLCGLGTTALLQLSSIQQTVKGLTNDLAPDSGIATEILEHVYQKRLLVKDYIRSSHQYDVERFKEQDKILETDLSKADQEIVNPKRINMLAEIKRLNKLYNESFTNIVVKKMQQSEQLVNSVLDLKGPLMEKGLSTIMDSAYLDQNTVSAFQGGSAQRHLLLARLYVFKFLVDNSDESAKKAQAELKTMSEILTTMMSDLQSQSRLDITLEVSKALLEYENAFAQIVTLVKTRNAAITDILDKNGRIMAQVSIELSDSVFGSMLEQGEEVNQTIASTNVSIVVFTLTAAVVGLFIAIVVTRGIVNPLRQTNIMLKDIAEGNGDLTKRITLIGRDEVGELGANFNKFVSKLQHIIGQINSATLQLASSAEELSAVTVKTNTGVTSQQFETVQVASAMTEMASSSQEVANNANEAYSIASEADEAAKFGDQVVSQTVQAINVLAKDVQDSTCVIEKLKSDSEGIGAVLDVIKSIADQTNLLALNAAIEAARAGESGRGFAVVADEVRTLAKRTQDSTAEIDNLISNLQGGAEKAMLSMEQSRNRATDTVSQAKEAGTALQTITHRVESILSMNIQITTAAKEQSTVVEDISRNISNIQEITGQTATATKEITTASNELALLGVNLQSLVNQFRV